MSWSVQIFSRSWLVTRWNSIRLSQKALYNLSESCLTQEWKVPRLGKLFIGPYLWKVLWPNQKQLAFHWAPHLCPQHTTFMKHCRLRCKRVPVFEFFSSLCGLQWAVDRWLPWKQMPYVSWLFLNCCWSAILHNFIRYFLFVIFFFFFFALDVAMRQRIYLQYRKHRFNPWIGKISWRRKWQPTQVFLPGKFHGQRSLVGYSLWVTKSRTWLSDYQTMQWDFLVYLGVPYSSKVTRSSTLLDLQDNHGSFGLNYC